MATARARLVQFMQLTNRTILASLMVLLASTRAGIAAADLNTTIRFDIGPQALHSAVVEYTEQSGVQITSAAELLKGQRSPGVVGEYPARVALTKLLGGTELAYDIVDANTVAIRPAAAAQVPGGRASGKLATMPDVLRSGSVVVRQEIDDRLDEDSASQNSEMRSPEASVDGSENRSSYAIPEVLVRGSKILNMDIKRSRDDVQPYVIFDRETIERSAAVDLNDFLKQRLTMNTQGQTTDQNGGLTGQSQINLRGLGTNQTLILVDGRRLASSYLLGTPGQSDLNGIPLAAIERIEVLPATASGIYGGGATGGVVNVVLRRDYAGVEAKASYENTFDTDSAIRRIELSSGFQLESGRTNVLLVGAYRDSNQLTAQDRRSFIDRGRQAILANNPGSFLQPFPFSPLGGTTNIRSSNGSPLFGPGTPSVTSVPVGYAGGGGLAPFLANAGTLNFDLADTQNTGGGAGAGFYTAPVHESLGLTIRRRFGLGFELFLEGGLSNVVSRFPTNSANPEFTIPATAPNNPFGQSIRVVVPSASADFDLTSHNKSRKATAGAIMRLPRQWNAEVDYSWSETSLAFDTGFTYSPAAAAAVANGSIDVLRDADFDFSPYLVPGQAVLTPFRTEFKDVTLRLGGPVWALPAGRPMLSILLEHRDEHFPEALFRQNATRDNLYPARSQVIDSVYMEGRVPLLSSRRQVTGVKELEIQLAARGDRYVSHGVTSLINPAAPVPIMHVRNEARSVNPTLGFRYSPLNDMAIRGSWGTGFLVAPLSRLTPSSLTTIGVLGIVDPRRGNEPLGLSIQAQGGGNPDLRPETSESMSLGLIFTPRWLPSARLSVDYTRIRKEDNVATLSVQQLLNNETIFPGRVTRAAPAPGDNFPVGRVTQIDQSALNIARAELEAFDVQIDYRLDLAEKGRVDLFSIGTWQPHYKTQLLPDAPIIDTAGISGVVTAGPLKFKANAGVKWQNGRWRIGWVGRYFHSYQVTDNPTTTGATTVANQGGLRVESQIYHDVMASYAFPAAEGSHWSSAMLADWQLELQIKNVLNSMPPFDASDVVRYYSNFGDPHLAVYHLSLKRSF